MIKLDNLLKYIEDRTMPLESRLKLLLENQMYLSTDVLEETAHALFREKTEKNNEKINSIQRQIRVVLDHRTRSSN